MSGVQTTFGGVCGAKKGGLALHFELESAQKHSAEVANGLLANAINNALPKAGIKKPPTRWLFFCPGTS